MHRYQARLRLQIKIDMEGSLLAPSLYTVKGILILDNSGERVFSKYYDPNIFPSLKEQHTFEKSLFTKTEKANSEILMLDGLTILYKNNVDLFFYVLGGPQENELVLLSVLNCVYDSISQIVRKDVEKRTVLDNLGVVLLAMDEICDGGIILESNANEVVSRVAIRNEDVPIGEQTVDQVLQSAKEQIKWSFFR